MCGYTKESYIIGNSKSKKKSRWIKSEIQPCSWRINLKYSHLDKYYKQIKIKTIRI